MHFNALSSILSLSAARSIPVLSLQCWCGWRMYCLPVGFMLLSLISRPAYTCGWTISICSHKDSYFPLPCLSAWQALSSWENVSPCGACLSLCLHILNIWAAGGFHKERWMLWPVCHGFWKWHDLWTMWPSFVFAGSHTHSAVFLLAAGWVSTTALLVEQYLQNEFVRNSVIIFFLCALLYFHK